MLTLADVVAIPELALRTVVEPAVPRPLRWVTTSELADPAQYLEGGELLLTTGLVAQDWAEYVARIDRAGVAALGFGTGLSHADVPPGLVAAARTGGLGLIAVPESTPFIAIGKAVAGLLAERERASTETALAVQQELTRVISRPDGRARALGVLARAGGGSAGLVDVDGRVLAPARFRVPDAAVRALATLRSGSEHGHGAHRRAGTGAAGGRAAVSETGAEGTTVVQPIGRQVDGPFLVLVTPGPLDGVLRAVLVSTVALLALDAERSRAAADAELRLRDRAAALVLDGAVDAGASVAALLGGAPEVPRRLRVLRATGMPPGSLAHLARNRPGVLTTATTPATPERSQGHPRGPRRDGGAPRGAGSGAVGTVALLVEDRDATDVAGLLADLGARVGIGPAVPATDAQVSDAAALTALSAAGGRTPVVDWDERFRGGVRAGLPDHAARALSASILGEVVGEPELLRTLHAYLVHLGRWQPTADALGIHRNTLRKRIARIERFTGRGVDTAAGRADLWVAVVIAGENPGAG